MRIHLVQMNVQVNDREANLKKILDYVDRGLSAEANLIVFGECALVGYDFEAVNYKDLAEPIPGPATEKVAEMIAGRNCYVVFGMAESDGGFVYNSAPLIGPEGVVGAARKLYLANFKSAITAKTYYEGVHFKPGQRIAVFDTLYGRIGIQVCLDLYHPEIAQAQALAGAWLIVHPSATPIIKGGGRPPSVWETRPWENSVCWCYVNIVGGKTKNEFNGATGVYLGTQGLQVQASMGEEAGEEVVEYEVDSKTVLAAKQAFSPLRDVRPELIKQLLTIAEKAQYGP